MGFRVNTRKTKIMSIRINDNTHVTVENEPNQEVEKFAYFGCEIRKGGDIGKEVSIRIGKARAAFRIMEKVRNEDGMSLLTKWNFLTALYYLYCCTAETPGKDRERLKSE